MPSKSKKQHRFMAAVANNPKFAKKAGVPQSVGKEYVKADKGRKFKEGGMPDKDWKSMGFPSKAMYEKYKEDEMDRKMAEGMKRYKEQKARPKTIMDDAAGNASRKPKAKAKAKSYAKGGKVRGCGVAKKGVKKAKMV